MNRTRLAQALVRHTVLEAWRTRLPLTLACTLVALLAVTVFVRALALIEEQRIAAIVYAALARPAALALVAFGVVASLMRERDDRGLQLVFAAAVPRTLWLTARYLGFAVTAAAIALAAGLPLALFAAPVATLAWSISLALEAALVAALALFAAIALRQIPSALAFVAGFYILGRTLGSLQWLAAPLPAHAGSPLDAAAAVGLALLVALAPPLDLWTRTAWLAGTAPGAPELGLIAAQAGIYVTLLVAAAAADFRVRSL